MVDPYTALAGGSALLGLSGGKKAKGAGNDAAAQIMQAWQQVQQQYQEMFAQALSSLAEGKEETFALLEEGLGWSIEERTKFYDIATKNLDWVVKFGKDYTDEYGDSVMGSYKALSKASEFYDHYKDLIHNPDIVYESEVYKSGVEQATQVWSDAMGADGMRDGTKAAALHDRARGYAYDYLRGERQDTLAGVQGGLGISDAYNRVGSQLLGAIGLGANAAGQQSQFAMATGQGNASDIMGAYGGMANAVGMFNQAPYLMQAADWLGNGQLNSVLGATGAQISGQNAQTQALGGLANAGLYGGIRGMQGGGFSPGGGAPSYTPGGGSPAYPNLYNGSWGNQNGYTPFPMQPYW